MQVKLLNSWFIWFAYLNSNRSSARSRMRRFWIQLHHSTWNWSPQPKSLWIFISKNSVSYVAVDYLLFWYINTQLIFGIFVNSSYLISQIFLHLSNVWHVAVSLFRKHFQHRFSALIFFQLPSSIGDMTTSWTVCHYSCRWKPFRSLNALQKGNVSFKFRLSFWQGNKFFKHLKCMDLPTFYSVRTSGLWFSDLTANCLHILGFVECLMMKLVAWKTVLCRRSCSWRKILRRSELIKSLISYRGAPSRRDCRQLNWYIRKLNNVIHSIPVCAL